MSKLGDKRFMVVGLLGFSGFIGCKYFSSGNPADLIYCANFAFFSAFILGGIRYERQDERWRTNYNKALAAACYVALACILAMGISAAWFPAVQEFMAGACAVSWTVSVLVYAVVFRSLERS